MMVLFPPCKINLGLRILRRRADGFHDLETLFFPLAICDALEVLRSATPGFTAYGRSIPGEERSNLCIRAYELLKADHPDLSPVQIHLYKQIPMGAGLGGGSSDGASMLLALDRLFRLELSPERLAEYALQLGSDCPFFLLEKPAHATGRGEILEAAEPDLSGYAFVVVHPGFGISTAEAFAGVAAGRVAVEGEARNRNAGGKTESGQGATSIREIVKGPVDSWRGKLVNDFEQWACAKYPVLSQIRERLYAAGAVYASMTGSGAAFYGIFTRAHAEAMRARVENGESIFSPDYFFRIL